MVGAAGCERAFVRRRVDAARQPRDDQKTVGRQLVRQIVRQHPPVGAGVARADHRDRRRGEQFGAAAHNQKRRRVGDFGEALWVGRLAVRDQRAAKLGDRGELGLSLIAPAAPPALLATGCACQPRQFLERAVRAAEPAQQLEEGLWPHPARTAELQPVDLLVARQAPPHEARKWRSTGSSSTVEREMPQAESGERRSSSLASVPCARRRRLAACLARMISASSRYSSAACT